MTSPTTDSTGQFKAMPAPFSTMFPRTDYFEADSLAAGARYAVWVTLPKLYAKDAGRQFPTIYMPDGNWNAAFAAGLPDLDGLDFMDPFQSTIQVGVGYVGIDADQALAVRARDLLPPHEALPPGIEEGVRNTAEAGLLDQAGADRYLHYLRNPAADRFLAFLTDELHPFLAARYRIQPDDIGLFGHSYGGLFATYAALQETTIFRNICASSPGILPASSVIFQLYADAIAKGGFRQRSLHMTVGTREITQPGPYQDLVGAGTTEFIRLAGQRPFEGLNFSSEFIDKETHITVKPAAIYAFLRRFYQRQG